MDNGTKKEFQHMEQSNSPTSSLEAPPAPSTSSRGAQNDAKRRRCVSTACIACRKRKSKCDGATPSCAACVSVYNTQCIYDPSSDHRRKGVYKKDIDGLKTRNSTLQTLVQAILNWPEDDVPNLVKKIRACESLDKVAEHIIARENSAGDAEDDDDEGEVPQAVANTDGNLTFESQLANKMGELRLDNGSVRMIGGTSNLLFLEEEPGIDFDSDPYDANEDPITSWTAVTANPELIKHLLNHYFTWHYTFFTILPRCSFERDFARGRRGSGYTRSSQYCSPVLVNAMLALGCHFSSAPGARLDPEDSATAGDHFFNEAKRLVYEDDLLDIPRLSTVQALALMSVREAGCAREARGWVYSGMAFRMACDLGLSFNSSASVYSGPSSVVQDEEELDAKRITFWGCFMIDKCWSNYLGRLPMFQMSANVTVPKFDVFPTEESSTWSAYSESGFSTANTQPSRVRTVALQLSALCDISSSLISSFYHPEQFEKPPTKQIEVKRLSEIHSRLEDWRRRLPKELEPKEGTLASVIVMHMFFQVLYIHLFRPFLKYNQATSPLPNNVSPRKFCTQAAGHISKLLRLYKRSHGLRQIVNIAVYITHSACTIHLLNLPEKNAKRDITHGVKSLEEIAEGWLCARRTLCVLSAQAKKWQVELPEEAHVVLSRTDAKFGPLASPVGSSPASKLDSPEHHRVVPQDPSQMRQTPASAPFSLQTMPQGMIYNDGTISPHTTTGSMTSFTPANSHPVSPYKNDTEVQKMFQEYAATANEMSPPSRQDHQTSQLATSWPGQGRNVSSLNQPQTQSRKRPLQEESAQMFGGVQALLREGQDWWMKDQSALASGFGNWNYPTGDAGLWPPSNSQGNGMQGHRPSNGGGPLSPSDGVKDLTQMPHRNGANQQDYATTNGYQGMAEQAAMGQHQQQSRYHNGQHHRNDSVGSATRNDFNDTTSSLKGLENTGNGGGLTSSGFAYPGLFSNSNIYNESEWYQ